jgi:hypothetical protein
MFISGVFVDRYRLDYSEMQCAAEIEDYQQGIALDLYNKHIRKIKAAGVEPKFFVDHVPSKMNEIDYQLLTMDEIKEKIA